MNKFFLLLLISSISTVPYINSTYSQSGIKTKIVDMFTKKKQIIALNNKIDSLESQGLLKDSIIKKHEETYESLMLDYNNLDIKREGLESELIKTTKANKFHKRQFDSISKVLEESSRYSIAQREADSIRYFTLLQKLSDKNKFVVDSLKRAHEVKRDQQEPARIENYYFNDFKSVITGTPDSKNRFTWTFELFKKEGENYLPAENEEVFNDKKDELLQLINARIKTDFEKAYALDPKCFTTSTPPNYTFKNLGLEFRDGKVNFYAVFDFATENCHYLYGYTVVEFSIEQLEDYFQD